MPDGIELATAYVTLAPSLKGATRSIQSQLSGIDLTKSGKSMGRSLADAMAKGMDSSALKGYEQAVTRAEKSLAAAMDRSADATARVEIAQKRLNEVREKHGTESSQAAQAELDLVQAERQAKTAAEAAEKASERLTSAQNELKAATEAAEAAAARQSTALGKLSSGMASASSKLESWSSKLKTAGGAMQGIGATMTATVTAPLAAGTLAVGKYALGVASAAETTEISFTTMLGSAEAAESMMDDLASFAASTPFELSGLQTATRQLLAYGFAAEDIIPMLTDVGDATAALGTGQQGIESVTRALGQMQTRGKVSADEMLQLTEAGIPAWEYLARAIGTDTAGAMEEVTKGAVSASDGIAAITSGMRDDFGGMMEQQSKTVAGLMSNLSDAIEQPLMELRNTEGYDRLAESLARLVDSAGPFVESLLPHMERGLEGVSGILDKACDAMDSFSNMSEEGQANIIGVATAAAGAGPALTIAGTGMKLLGSMASGASKVIGAGAKAIGKLTSGAEGVSKPMGTAAGSTEKFGESAKKTTTQTGKLTKGLGLLKGGLAGLGIGVVVSMVANLASKFSEAEEHADLLAEATKGISEISADAGGRLGELSRSSSETLQSLVNLGDSAADSMADIAAQSAELDGYVATIERLADKSNLSAQEQWELKAAVEGYNSVTGSTVEIIDGVNGKLSDSTTALMENAEAWEKNAKAQAMQELASDYLKEQYQIQNDLEKAQKKFDEVSQGGEGLWILDGAISDEQGRAFHEAKQNLDDLSASLQTASDNYDYFAQSAVTAMSGIDSTLQETLLTMPAEMQQMGYDSAMKLSEGISSGNVNAQSAAQFLKDSVSLVANTLPSDMHANGMNAVNMLASALSEGQITASEAAMILKAAVSGNVSSLPAELQGLGYSAASALGASMSENSFMASTGAQALYNGVDSTLAPLPGAAMATGTETGSSLAGGIGSQEGNVSSQSSRLGDATQQMNKNAGNSWSWGNELGNNLAAGISAAWGAVTSAASSLASGIASFLHFSEPDKGALVGINDSGYELGSNYAASMRRSIPLVSAASSALADAASFTPAFGARSAYAGAASGGNSYSLSIDGMSVMGRERLFDLMLQMFDILHREGTM